MDWQSGSKVENRFALREISRTPDESRQASARRPSVLDLEDPIPIRERLRLTDQRQRLWQERHGTKLYVRRPNRHCPAPSSRRSPCNRNVTVQRQCYKQEKPLLKRTVPER